MPIMAKILDDQVVIETRSNSTNLQARWKSNLEGRLYERVSLDTDDLEIAKRKARTEFERYRAFVITGMPLESERTIKYVGEEYLKSLGDKAKLGTQMKHYVSAIENYIIPIIGNKKITEVNQSVVDEFNNKRNAMMGKVPKKGTVSKHHSALKKIYLYAIDKKYCSTNDIPPLSVKGKGAKGEPRPAFTDEEVIAIWDKFDKWIELATRSDIIYRRKILKLYCFFLYKVGCRPGVEIDELKWSCVDHGTNGEITLFIHKSKYEEKIRHIIIPHIMLKTLYDIGKLTQRTGLDDYIFCSPLGHKLVDLSRTFKSFLEFADLTVSKSGKYKDRERTLYSFRHTFATQNVRHMTIGEISDMADYMGTSPEMIVRFYVESNADLFARKYVIGSPIDGIVEFYKDGAGSKADGFEIAHLYSAEFD